jgi:hypothetical protein
MIPEDIDSLENLPGGPQVENGAARIVKELLEYSREAVSVVFREIKSESRSIASERLNLASAKLDTLAEVLGESAAKLRTEQSDSLADIFEVASNSIGRLSKNVRETNPEKIADEAAEFARRQPAIFLSSAVVAGILLGQIFSSPDGRQSDREFLPGRESSFESMPEDDKEEHLARH